MASFGQLTNAFLRASQETTLAFANFNFDFSIFKYDAPAEYNGLGNALSKRRKQVAEDGPVHVTARKLNALFRGVMPECPNLIQAYGLRASQIASLPEVNPQGLATQGVFADHVGADGTTIWAAATSGKETVTIHLLACMLARMWNREQSLSIWSELVEQRKACLKDLAAESEVAFNVPDLAASRIEITRSHIDEWDRSARAWLQTADTAKKRPQTQLRLLIDNMSLPVSSKAIVLESVLEAWKKALQALECLIKGEALQINDGAILLGLSAWHIYPDIVLAGTNEYIKQGDELVHPGGIVTLGLINRRGDDGGMFWSLPLAHARYYGGVEITKRHAGVRESQVSFEEFTFVVLGSILSGWGANDLDLSAQLGLIQDIGKAVRDDIPDARPQSVREMDSVLTYLSSLVSQYTKAKDVYKQQITRLISFGRRRCSDFLAPRPFQPLPAFGLVNFTTLMGTFSKDNEDSVKFLRSWAKREMPSDFTSCAVIRYRTGNYTLFKYTNVDDQEPHPKKKPRTNAVGNTSSATETSHLHWIEDIDVKKRQEDRTGEVLLPPGPGEKSRRYLFFCGDSDLAAIYFPADRKVPEIPRKNCMSVPQLISCIQHENLTLPQIAIALRRMASSLTYEAYIDSLRAIGRAESIYSKLPGAKVDLQVTSTRISEAKWWKEIKSQQACTLPAIFSCIAYFEIGIFDANPETIGEHTFALCHGTSIFVANSLLTDPIDEASIIPVKRIVGNIGKPGLAFLTSPSTPEIRKVDYSSWHAVSHLPFDGAAQNNFPATSFHLSFTGYEYAMDLNRQSGRDAPAHLVETAIAVYDKGNWVADLDIIKASRSWVKVARWDCQHSDEEKADVSSLGPIVSVDCWEELLDPPVENAVVRSHKNWAARLATAALAVQIGLHVRILPPTQCWMCLYTEIASQETQGDVVQTSETDEYEEIKCSDSEDGREIFGSETNYDLDGNLDDGEIDIYSFRLPTPEAASEEQAKPRAILIY